MVVERGDIDADAIGDLACPEAFETLLDDQRSCDGGNAVCTADITLP